jgi:hypothetical protein
MISGFSREVDENYALLGSELWSFLVDVYGQHIGRKSRIKEKP